MIKKGEKINAKNVTVLQNKKKFNSTNKGNKIVNNSSKNISYNNETIPVK